MNRDRDSRTDPRSCAHDHFAVGEGQIAITISQRKTTRNREGIILKSRVADIDSAVNDCDFDSRPGATGSHLRPSLRDVIQRQSVVQKPMKFTNLVDFLRPRNTGKARGFGIRDFDHQRVGDSFYGS